MLTVLNIHPIQIQVNFSPLYNQLSIFFQGIDPSFAAE